MKKRVRETVKQILEMEMTKIINNVVHFDGSFGTEIALEDILQTLRGIDIHVQSRGFVEHFCIWVEHSQRHLCIQCVELGEEAERIT